MGSIWYGCGCERLPKGLIHWENPGMKPHYEGSVDNQV